ncbi:hypothetical protein RclHR1_11860003 [Rhizophagus clarus]|uniref:Kinase-like domain-containing protein n=1 Tax=Rhizophagus clarus TaxID=94130 RepID=A0A2Z6QYD3_9GLOM|nr:hypothetical protein RclHR1_11860003 [Rhizophagus clarus]GES86120.1 kinase-like domain-containing protein [Rhizophagus clarus]
MEFFKKIFKTKTHLKNENLYEQDFGLCPECKQPNTYYNWCKECYSKKFEQNFDKWTSNEKQLDEFIRMSQLEAKNSLELLEWIPYSRLRDIKFLARGGFGTVYDALWLDGWIIKWDYTKQDWERNVNKLDEQDFKDAVNPKIENRLESNEKYGFRVVLKSLDNSSDINENFLNESKLHYQCQCEISSTNDGFTSAPLIGITQDPHTSNYMIVMRKIENGSLRMNLFTKKYNPNDKFYNLYLISLQLEAMHKLNLIHGDIHGGNILCLDHATVLFSDFGLCRLADQPNTENTIFGVLPYVAPEILRRKTYTKAADIYSFGMIMWEMTSGSISFHDVPHDAILAIKICQGFRPEIIEGTTPEYAELMKRCWDRDPAERPTAEELKNFFYEWSEKHPIEMDEEMRTPIPDENEGELEIYSTSKFDINCGYISIPLITEELVEDSVTTEGVKFVIYDRKPDKRKANFELID